MILQPEIRCVEFVDELTDWMEGDLGEQRRELLEEHLTICPECTRYIDQMRAALTTLRTIDETPALPGVGATVLEALRQRRSDEQRSGE